MPSKKSAKKLVRQSASKSPIKPAKDLLAGYEEFLNDLKQRIRSAQIKVSLAVNSELITLYWDIGKDIVEKQEAAGWGDAVLDRLGHDLTSAFPGIQGFSRTNLYRMRALYLAWRHQSEFVPQLVGQIPWGHNQILIEKVKATTEREWYARQTIKYGWSRAVLSLQIETDLYARQAVAEKTHNFALTLPPVQSDLAQELLKDEYVFDFLTLRADAHEREIERGLVERIRDFLLELGAGFAFVGSQYHLEVDGRDFYLDLLFYHLDLRCFIVIDLKVKEFQPEDAGKMNFYLSAADDLLRRPGDERSIGIILCKGRSRTVAEYALRDLHKPLGVSNYRHQTLPKELAEALPSPEVWQKMLEEA